MKLSEYFDKADGFGVLSTADQSGKVDAAIYGRPHFMDEETVAFIAADKLTHANLQVNPHAVYISKKRGIMKAADSISPDCARKKTVH